MSISTPDVHQHRKQRKMRVSPTSPVLLTPTESEISEPNQYAEWLNVINGNATTGDCGTKCSSRPNGTLFTKGIAFFLYGI